MTTIKIISEKLINFAYGSQDLISKKMNNLSSSIKFNNVIHKRKESYTGLYVNNNDVRRNIMRYSITYVSIPTKIIINKRTMFGVKQIVKTAMHETTMPSNTLRNMSYVHGQKLSKVASKELSNDNSGKHVHVVKTTCVEKDCDTKKCTNTCNDPKFHKILGHNTHKPPVGRMTRFVSDHDAKGEANPQYFVKTNKNVELTEEEKKQYGNHVKEDNIQKDFINKYRDKYD